MSLDREVTALGVALADASTRTTAAAALASRLGAHALLIFVADRAVEAMVPAPGLPQTIVGGPTWRALLSMCEVAGVHRATVAYPSRDVMVSAFACVGSGVALVFVGGDVELASVEPLVVLLPIIGVALHSEHTVSTLRGEVLVARQDARHAATLARSLDTTRADLERQTQIAREARSVAEGATRAKDEFLAMLGHELRNPLAPILTALQLMRLAGQASREQDVLERQVGHLMRLVDDLLDVARIAGGKVELRKQRVEIAQVATRAIEISTPMFERKSQQLVVAIPSTDLAVDGDPDRLAQVFSNLLTNAAKYSDPNTRITFTAAREDDKVVVRVEDQGDGIDPSMLGSVFELFTQQRQSIARSQGGLGLGLAIVKNLVGLHGGSVRAESRGRGAGSAFVVELPHRDSVESGPVTRTSTLPGLRVARASKRILVVDDNQDALELLSLTLSKQGFVVGTAHDGPSALQVAERFQPNVAVLDIGLPVMDGYELGKRLRSQFGGSLKLIALTGYGRASDQQRSIDAGFDAHLVKPVVVADLQQLLDRLPP